MRFKYIIEIKNVKSKHLSTKSLKKVHLLQHQPC